MEDSRSASWWLDARNRPPNQSPWLQAILSDLDEKIKRIVNLIEDEDDSFIERAELFYKRRPELLNILRELHQSYQNLADNYDKIQLAETARFAQLRSPFSSLRFRQTLINRVKTEEGSPNLNPPTQTSAVKAGDDSVTENIWEELEPKMTKVVEDNMRQQMELIRRNEEKRELIKELRVQVSRLMEENRAMRSFISSYKVEFKRSDSSNFKFKGLNCLGSFHSPN